MPTHPLLSSSLFFFNINIAFLSLFRKKTVLFLCRHRRLLDAFSLFYFGAPPQSINDPPSFAYVWGTSFQTPTLPLWTWRRCLFPRYHPSPPFFAILFKGVTSLFPFRKQKSQSLRPRLFLLGWNSFSLFFFVLLRWNPLGKVNGPPPF